MKKAFYQRLYQILLSLSNRFNIRFFAKCKVLLGTSLIVLTSSCSKDDDDEPEIMCYDPVPTKESVEKQPESPPSTEDETIHFSEIV